MGDLDNKTPLEVADDPTYRVRLLGLIRRIEIAEQQHFTKGIDYNQLREKLGLPLLEMLDPAKVNVAQLPLVRLARLPVDRLSDDQLKIAYDRAESHGIAYASYALGIEILQRKELCDKLPSEQKAELCARLAQTSLQPEECLELIHKAREIAEAEGVSPAPYLLQEMPLQLQMNNPKGCVDLIDRIYAQHINEPGIHEALVKVLIQIGILDANGQPQKMPSMPPTDTPAAAPTQEGIWTPGSDNPQTEEKPTIWTPGMD
jgi:hypothetical protein